MLRRPTFAVLGLLAALCLYSLRVSVATQAGAKEFLEFMKDKGVEFSSEEVAQIKAMQEQLTGEGGGTKTSTHGSFFHHETQKRERTPTDPRSESYVGSLLNSISHTATTSTSSPEESQVTTTLSFEEQMFHILRNRLEGGETVPKAKHEETTTTSSQSTYADVNMRPIELFDFSMLTRHEVHILQAAVVKTLTNLAGHSSYSDTEREKVITSTLPMRIVKLLEVRDRLRLVLALRGKGYDQFSAHDLLDVLLKSFNEYETRSMRTTTRPSAFNISNVHIIADLPSLNALKNAKHEEESNEDEDRKHMWNSKLFLEKYYKNATTTTKAPTFTSTINLGFAGAFAAGLAALGGAGFVVYKRKRSRGRLLVAGQDVDHDRTPLTPEVTTDNVEPQEEPRDVEATDTERSLMMGNEIAPDVEPVRYDDIDSDSEDVRHANSTNPVAGVPPHRRIEMMIPEEVLGDEDVDDSDTRAVVRPPAPPEDERDISDAGQPVYFGTS